MKMFNVRKQRGFSLVELMIVVAIIAILAAIAIPAFLRFALKSKTAEATSNLNAIRTCEEAYRAENDVYIASAVTATPDGGGTDSEPDEWTGAGVAEFAEMGFEPDGDVRYTYIVTLATDGDGAPIFEIVASCDLDENGTAGTYTVTKGDPGYPKPVQAPAGEF